MAGGELICIDPMELNFALEVRRQISCAFQVLNMTDNRVAFKVKTTNPKKYSVRPNSGIVLRRTTCSVTAGMQRNPKSNLKSGLVTMQAQKEAPADMQCKDKFLVQCVAAPSTATPADITPEMEYKLRVCYVLPPRPPSPVPEELGEGSSPRSFESDESEILNTRKLSAASRGYDEPQENLTEAMVLLSKLTEDKNSAIEENAKLRQELKLLRRGGRKHRGGISILYVFLICLLAIYHFGLFHDEFVTSRCLRA